MALQILPFLSIAEHFNVFWLETIRIVCVLQTLGLHLDKVMVLGARTNIKKMKSPSHEVIFN